MKRFFSNYDLLLSSFITFIGIVGIIYFQFSKIPGPTGPFIFPKLSCIIIIIFGILTIIDSISTKYMDPNPEVNILSVLLFGIMSLIYVLIFSKIGMIIATFLFLLFSFTILTPKDSKKFTGSLFYSIFFTVFLWIIFVKIFNIILPDYILF